MKTEDRFAWTQVRGTTPSLDTTSFQQRVQDALHKLTPVENHFQLDQALADIWDDHLRVRALCDTISSVVWERMNPDPLLQPPPGLARKIFDFRPLEAGEMMKLAVGIDDICAFNHSGPRDLPNSITLLEPGNHGKYICPTGFNLCTSPTFDLSALTMDDLERAVDMAFMEISTDEDLSVIKLLNAVTKPIELTSKNLVNKFEQLRDQLVQNGQVPQWIFMNRELITKLFCQQSREVEPVTSRAHILAGVVAKWETAWIAINSSGLEEVVPPNMIYMVADSDALGRAGQRIKLFGEPFNLVDKDEIYPYTEEQIRNHNLNPKLPDGRKTGSVFHLRAVGYAPITNYGFSFLESIELGLMSNKGVVRGLV